MEPFDRGWYAGIVGTIGFDASDFAVALRSALIYNESLSLYAGVGLVEESEADLEWDEGDWKLRNFEELIRAVSLA